MKIDLPNDDGTNVIQLSVVRESVYAKRLFGKQCAHQHVTADTSLAELQCNICKERLNAVNWIADMVTEWYRVLNLYAKYREMKASYEGKTRCRCEHCHKITKVTPPTAAEIREFKEKQK